MPVEIKIICDECRLTVNQNIDEEGPEVYLPDNWLTVEDNGSWLYFHSRECHKEWLRKQGRLDDIQDYENLVPIA